MLVRLATSRILKMAGDVAVMNLSFIAAFLIRFGGTLPSFNFQSFEAATPWLSLAGVALLSSYDLYDREHRPWQEERYSIAVAAVIQMVAAAAISFLIRGFTLPRSVLAIALVLEVAGLLLWRSLLMRIARLGRGRERVLILGEGAEAARLAARLAADALVEVWLPRTASEAGARLLHARPDMLYVGSTLPEALRQSAVTAGLDHGCRVYLIPSLYDILLSHSRLAAVADMPLLSVSPLRLPAGAPLFKRSMDLVLAVAGLCLTAPIMALVALAVLLLDGRPVLYSQERLTQSGRVFTLYKFRTMRRDAERTTGPVISSGADDSRVTPLGRLLRSTRLDELPQLVNILAGDMTVVGPRPERPHFVQQFLSDLPEYRYRFAYKAGLTGLAQVEGRYSTHVHDKVRFDLLYLRTYSPLVDLSILLKTLRTLWIKSKAC